MSEGRRASKGVTDSHCAGREKGGPRGQDGWANDAARSTPMGSTRRSVQASAALFLLELVHKLDQFDHRLVSFAVHGLKRAHLALVDLVEGRLVLGGDVEHRVADGSLEVLG